MDVVGIILVIVALGLVLAALFSQIAWGAALLYLAGVGLVAFVIYLILPRFRKSP